MDPFKITGPAVIALSFGRTSGYMLWRILRAWGGQLPPDVHVMFQNTGKEAAATLAFGNEMQRRWGVPVRWLEYRRRYLPIYKSEDRRLAAERARLVCGHVYEAADGRKEPGFVDVTYETASRAGEPFHNLIDLQGLPTISTRICTAEMKIRVQKKAMMALGYTEWDNVVGLRADEPLRVARRKGLSGNRWTDVMPLAEAGVTNQHVLDFWDLQPFDLALPTDASGVTVGGNCDLCFLKGAPKKLSLIRADPSVSAWWEAQEARTGHTFRIQGDSYEKLRLRAIDPVEACVVDGDDLGDCTCTD